MNLEKNVRAFFPQGQSKLSLIINELVVLGIKRGFIVLLRYPTSNIILHKEMSRVNLKESS